MLHAYVRWCVCGLLAVCLGPALAVAVTSYQYTNPGTPITFGDSGATVTWTLSNRGAGTGQVSPRYDKGAGAQPSRYDLRCQISLTGTNVVGQQIEYYLVFSDGTNQDGGVSATNATIASDQRRVLELALVLTVYQTTTNTTMYASKRNLFIPTRYVSLAMWNATGLPTETSTTKHQCALTPTPFQMQ